MHLNVASGLAGHMRGLALAYSLLMSGCALTTDEVILTYKSPGPTAKIDGAAGSKVSVDLFDIRGMKDRVSVKKNGYGMEMAPIVSQTSVSDLLTKSIESELTARGFTLGIGAARLFVELQKFYNDFKTGFWSGSAAAELILNTQVKTSAGEILFSKLVVGTGSVPSIQLMTGDNAKAALEDALTDGMSKLFSDRAMLDAIIKASHAKPIEQNIEPAIGGQK
jgi:uncharacterized lipoprotein YajG